MTYRQAGVYTCEVDYGAGVQLATKEVLVHCECLMPLWTF